MNLIDIDQLRNLQQQGAVDHISSLRTIELNPIEICNRNCEFCPRHDPKSYANKNYKMSLDLIKKIIDDLKEIDYNGRISFVGFGEPLLYKDLCQAIKLISDSLPNLGWIEVNTNGDFLNASMAKELSVAGCTNVTISMYDKDISHSVIEMFKDCNIQLSFKHCYPEKFELKLVNREQMLIGSFLHNIERPCYLPFYKMFIDWNGDVLICNNDWGRKGIIGNLFQNSISEIWSSDTLKRYQRNLSQGNRNKCNPCNRCNIQGDLYGQESYSLIMGKL